MNFCELVLELHCHKVFVTHTQAPKHFPEIVRSSSGHSKTVLYYSARSFWSGRFRANVLEPGSNLNLWSARNIIIIIIILSKGRVNTRILMV